MTPDTTGFWMYKAAFGSTWRVMIAVNVAVAASLATYKVTQHFPQIGYQHLLVDYHFGFLKRAIVGELVSFIFPKVPIWFVFALGGAIWVATLALFLAAFRRCFGFGERQLPLFVFTICSPLVMKNFIQTVGYFDIYGCAVGLILLLVPARHFIYVIGAGAASLALLFVHHIHALLYVPTLAAIVGARYYLAVPRSRLTIVSGFAILVMLFAALVVLQFLGTATVPQKELDAYMLSRMAGPTFPFIDSNIWYQTLDGEIRATWSPVMTKNLLRVPVYVAVIALHAPLIGYLRSMIAARANPWDRRLIWLAIGLISAAYLVLFVTVFDYSRWVANWFTCMVLLLFAISGLPASSSVEPISDEKNPRALGWLVTILPRLGTTIPF